MTSAPSTLRVWCPIKTQSEMNMREHHMVRASRQKKHRRAAHVVLRSKGRYTNQLCSHIDIYLTRHSCGRLDDDNLRSALKSCRDGIADWLGIDDGDSRLHFHYAQEKCERGKFGVMIEIGARVQNSLFEGGGQ